MSYRFVSSLSSARAALERINVMFNAHTIGAKYDETKHLDIADIAKLVRKDIRELVKSDDLPEFKYSVRIDRFSGGQAIRVSIQSSKTLDVTEYREAFHVNRYDIDSLSADMQRKYVTANETYDKVRSVVEAYNYDASDAMVDYFNVRFYATVSYSY